ncbi:hypothetical protein ACLQ2S_19150 [Micromonospora sp. DT48]|uniref:hypothetical protein n=1 Tax=Micromonospora sp. DT48 TaxID=3393429 RepID=UPI003CF16AE9
MDLSEDIKHRVEIFLAEEEMEREDLRLYLAGLRDLIMNVATRIGRSALFMVLGVAIFVLLSHGELAEVELFGVKAEKFGLFRLAIPVVVAYLSARIVILINTRSQLVLLYREFVHKSFPRWGEAQLGLIPLGILTIFLSAQPIRLTRVEFHLARVTFYVETAIILLMPALFGIYAYVSIFSDDSIDFGWAALSSLVALGFVVLTFFHVVAGRLNDDVIQGLRERLRGAE